MVCFPTKETGLAAKEGKIHKTPKPKEARFVGRANKYGHNHYQSMWSESEEQIERRRPLLLVRIMYYG